MSNQYIYRNNISTYDPNLSSAARYSPTSDINSYDTHNPEKIAITAETSDFTPNCVSNVIFLPSTCDGVTTSNFPRHQLPELVKCESSLITSSHKFIFDVSPQQIHHLTSNNNASYILKQTTQNDLYQQQQQQSYHSPDAHTSEQFDHEKTNEITNIHVDNTNSQLYHQNIYVNQNQITSHTVELIPTLARVNDMCYANEGYNVIYPTDQNLQLHHLINENQLATSVSKNNNDSLQLVNDRSQYTTLEPVNHSQFAQQSDTSGVNQRDQSNVSTSVMEKEQQRILLESTMSPLCEYCLFKLNILF